MGGRAEGEEEARCWAPSCPPHLPHPSRARAPLREEVVEVAEAVVVVAGWPRPRWRRWC